MKIALELLGSIMGLHTPPPFIGPTPDGSLQIEWHEHGLDVEIRIRSATKFDVSVEDRRDPVNDFDDVIANDFKPIRRAVSVLEMRAKANA